MQLTHEQKQSLKEKLNEEVGREKNAMDDSKDFYSVYQLVTSLIPYEIRDPEGSLQINGVVEAVQTPSAGFVDAHIDLNHQAIDRIPPNQLKLLHQGIEKIVALTKSENGLRPTSEILFDKLIKNSRDVLLQVMGALNHSLAVETHNLSSQSLDDMAEGMMKLYEKAGIPQPHSERTQESEISAHQRIHNMILDNIDDSIIACRKMLAIHDTVLTMMQKDREHYVG